MNLKNKTISGIIWNGAGKLSNQIIQFVIMIVLARLLTPSDFGIIGIVFIFIRFIALLNETGIVAAIIQKETIDKKDLSTLFVASLMTGLVLSFFLIISTSYIADFFQMPALEPILKLAALTFVFGALGVVQKSLLNRELNFKEIARAEILGSICYGLISITLAATGFGVWSLIWGIIAWHLVMNLIFILKSEWKIQISFYLERFKRLIRFGLNVFFTNFVMYTGNNITSFITGKFLGPAPLGLYSLANNVTSQTVGRLSFIVGRVMFPALARIQDDNIRFQNAYLKVLDMIAMISFPILIGVSVIAKPFVGVLLGEKWSGTVFPLQALAMVSILNTIGVTIGFVLLAKGRSDIEFKWNLVTKSIFIAMLLMTVRYGLNTMVLGIVFYYLLTTPIIIKITYSFIDLSLWRVIKRLFPTFLSAVLMAAGIYLVMEFIFKSDINLIGLIGLVLFGAILFCLFMLIFNKRQLNEIKASLADSIVGDKYKHIKNGKPGYLFWRNNELQEK